MTDYNNIVRLVIKLIGVGLVVYAVTMVAFYIPGLVASLKMSSVGQMLVYSSPLVITGLIGLFLWLFPAKIANTIVGSESAMEKAGNEWDARLERVGISILGIFLLYKAVSDLVYYVAGSIVSAPTVKNLTDFRALMVATVIEVIVALFLVLGSAGITNLLRKLRGAN